MKSNSYSVYHENQLINVGITYQLKSTNCGKPVQKNKIKRKTISPRDIRDTEFQTMSNSYLFVDSSISKSEQLQHNMTNLNGGVANRQPFKKGNNDTMPCKCILKLPLLQLSRLLYIGTSFEGPECVIVYLGCYLETRICHLKEGFGIFGH